MTNNPQYDFAGQVALVTGAASGMGLAAARGFAENGAAVALLDRSADAVEKTAQDLVDAGHRAIGIACDVTDEAQVAAAIDWRTPTRPGSCVPSVSPIFSSTTWRTSCRPRGSSPT